MKKFCFFLSIFAMLFLLGACGDTGTDTNADTKIELKYVAGEGGTIDGETTQSADIPFTGASVTAIASEGYRFTGWSDGYSEPTRTDTIEASATLTANFIKVHTITFSCDTRAGLIMGQASQTLDDGAATSEVSIYVRFGYKFMGWSNGMTDEKITVTAKESGDIRAIIVRDGLSLPVISINTEDYQRITSTSEYLNCSVTVENTDDAYKLTNASAKIRGRGNTTWEYDKKPYRLKFDTKTDLFGNGEARDWTLIANHSDLSLSRNYLAQSVASLFSSISETTSVQFVELYVNYEYLGVYLACEQIEAGENRVSITQSTEVDTGYLIELDGRKDGRYFTIDKDYYVVKDPDTDDATYTDEHEAFIKGYLSDCLDALNGEDYERVKELIDVESFAESYLVYELFNGVDVGYSSFFMHKDAGGKLYCGPVWDFDRSLGVVGHSEGAKAPNTLWARAQNTWFKLLLTFPEFEELVGKRLEEYAPKINERLTECYTYLYKNRDSFDRNFERWKILGTFVWPNDDELTALDTWDAQVEYTRAYLSTSLDYLISVYCKQQS